MNPFTLMLLVVSMAFGSCRGSQSHSHESAGVQQLADETLGKENIIEFNDSKTYALCQQKPGADHARRKYRFVVIRVKDSAIVHDGLFSMGGVSWADDRSIEVSESGSGTESGTKKIIDVTSGAIKSAF